MAHTAKGTEVSLSFVPDIGWNEGGFLVEIYKGPDCGGDPFDWFIIRDIEDCDCKNMDEVEKFAEEWVSQIKDY